MYVSVRKFLQMIDGTLRDQKRAWDTLKLELQMTVSGPPCMLETELGSLGREVYTLN